MGIAQKSILCLVGFFIYMQLLAQGSNSSIAPFKIRLTNGAGYTYQQLAKNKPVILVYFSPTCDHCKVFTEKMLQRIDDFKDEQLVMISYEDIKAVKSFDDRYKLSARQNIKIGSEGYTFIVQKYYNIQHFPFVAEYDKTGRLKKMMKGNLKPEDMAAGL
jgi:thioredoxin-related protein